MRIVCATVSAAAQVLDMLYAAHVQPVRDFTIQPAFDPIPPITFTLVVVLTAAQVKRIRALADTTTEA